MGVRGRKERLIEKWARERMEGVAGGVFCCCENVGLVGLKAMLIGM